MAFLTALIADYQDPRLAGQTTVRTLNLGSPKTEECIEVRAYVLPAAQSQDMLNPIEFRMNYDIDEKYLDNVS